MFGQNAWIPVDVIYDTPVSEENVPILQYVCNLRQSLRNAFKLARNNMNSATAQQKELYDLLESLWRSTQGGRFGVAVYFSGLQGKL